MKAISAILLLASFCLLANLRADLAIVQKFDGLGQSVESTTKIKGGKIRVDAAPGTSIIMDLKAGSWISLMHAQKKYMQIPGQMAQAAIDSMKDMQGGQTPAAPTVPTPTGKKEIIGGYATEEYTCNVRGAKVALWLTTAIPGYQAMLQEMGKAFSQGPLAVMMKNIGVDFASLPGFPIRTVSEVKPAQVMSSTIISVSSNPLPDSDFEIPPDYTEVKIPSLTPPAAEQAPAVSK